MSERNRPTVILGIHITYGKDPHSWNTCSNRVRRVHRGSYGTPPTLKLHRVLRGATDDNVRAAITAFPGMLQRIDDWIAEGILGGDPPNAADLQIAPSLRLAMSLDDLRGAIEDRPATGIVKHFPGRTPAVLPPEWLEPITAPAG